MRSKMVLIIHAVTVKIKKTEIPLYNHFDIITLLLIPYHG